MDHYDRIERDFPGATILYDDKYDEYLPYYVCDHCGQLRRFNIRTSDAEGGRYFCGMECCRAAAEASGA